MCFHIKVIKVLQIAKTVLCSHCVCYSFSSCSLMLVCVSVCFDHVTVCQVCVPLTGYMWRGVEDWCVFPTRFLQLVSSVLHDTHANFVVANIMHHHVYLWTSVRQVHFLVCAEHTRNKTHKNNMSKEVRAEQLLVVHIVSNSHLFPCPLRP